ncbi:MAG: class I SAM-dependent methyltransferase [Anaerolineaceae bacterium]|nr:class I SAM-dependent methyltransferase [Anaerolineaceae bacterium]
MFEVRTPNRSHLFDIIPQDEIVARYRANYGLGPEIGLEHVRLHADLEATLTDRLIAAPAASRSTIFEEAYSELYSSLPWLASVGTNTNFEPWAELMEPKSKVYEIGSGNGNMAEFLAQKAFDVTATEITTERGKQSRTSKESLRWHKTDGVHLDEFEEPESYNYILSDQVVEHLHPHDIITHFRTARVLLKPGGSYIVRTPHRRHGPADLSRVFKLEEPAFMHLHEYSYLEFDSICRGCDYSEVLAITNLGPLSRKLGFYRPSRWFYAYLKSLDRIESSACRSRMARRAFRKLSRFLMSSQNAWVKLVR